MQRHITESKQTNDTGQSHAPTFAKVQDGRKQDIRGLWVRNGRYYGRLSIENANGDKVVRRVPLLDKEKNPVQTVPQAIEALNRLKVKRTDNDLPVLHRTPRFSDYVTTYLEWIEAGKDNPDGSHYKKPRTISKEKSHLNGWIEDIGGVRLDKINLRHINARIAKRLKSGTSKRTIKLDIIALNNILNHAIAEGVIKTLPRLEKEARKRLRSEPKARELFTSADLEALCTAAMDTNEDGSPVTKNWLQFCDYIRLLAYSGAREKEALALRWGDVDFDREQLMIGSDGDTKNHTGRKVDFNSKLRAHLQEMQKRRLPKTESPEEWLFPSPQRGEKDIHAKTFRESLKLVRAHAAKKDARLAHKAFHDLRHYFASYCVMSGIDFKTVSQWLGHRDGGFLVCKTYSHLADEHKKAQAAKVNFSEALPEQGK